MYRKWKSQVDIVDVICHPKQWRIVTEDARYHNTFHRCCDFNIHQILPTLKHIVYKKDNVHYYLKIFHLNWNLHTLTLCVRWFKTFSHLHNLMRNSMHINIPNLSELFCDPFPKSFCTLCLSMFVRSIFFNFRNISFFTNRFITFYLYDHINVNQQQVKFMI